VAILKIARMGHPVLRVRAEEVEDPAAPDTARIVADMIDTMQDASGVGLAAPQVHISQRIVVFYVPKERADDPQGPDGTPGGPQPLTVLINPLIEPLSPVTTLDFEACLSVAGLAGIVPRYTHIRYAGFGLDGARIEREAVGFHARVVQHECDHLDGILYPQRITDLRDFGFADEFQRFPPTKRGQEEQEEKAR